MIVSVVRSIVLCECGLVFVVLLRVFGCNV